MNIADVHEAYTGITDNYGYYCALVLGYYIRIHRLLVGYELNSHSWTVGVLARQEAWW